MDKEGMGDAEQRRGGPRNKRLESSVRTADERVKEGLTLALATIDVLQPPLELGLGSLLALSLLLQSRFDLDPAKSLDVS